jgi:BirA family biotin operon repressor/biotin-[acetyl-CoA-carboxylase] ligase
MNRVWHSSPGKGLALSVLLHPGCDPTTLSTTPLVAGLALRRGLDALGVEAWLKWPNDLLVRGRKLSGILAESRRNAEGMDVIVLGVGVNVSQESQDFPPELRDRATSIAIEGREAGREAVAAAFLNALEPLWDEHVEGDPGKVLDAWRSEAGFWGRRIVAHTPQGRVEGVAYGLDVRGGLVVRTPAGETRTVVTADLEVEWPDGSGGGGTPA